MFNTQKIFAVDIKTGIGEQKMDVGNASGVGIFDRYHGQIGLVFLDQVHGDFKGVAGNVVLSGKDVAAGNMRIGAGDALVGNFGFHLVFPQNFVGTTIKRFRHPGNNYLGF